MVATAGSSPGSGSVRVLREVTGEVLGCAEVVDLGLRGLVAGPRPACASGRPSDRPARAGRRSRASPGTRPPLAARRVVVAVDDHDPAHRDLVVEPFEDLVGLLAGAGTDPEQGHLLDRGRGQRPAVGALEEPHPVVEQVEALEGVAHVVEVGAQVPQAAPPPGHGRQEPPPTDPSQPRAGLAELGPLGTNLARADLKGSAT